MCCVDDAFRRPPFLGDAVPFCPPFTTLTHTPLASHPHYCQPPTTKSIRTVRIDGGTSVDERQDVVDAFNARGVGQVRVRVRVRVFVFWCRQQRGGIARRR